MQMGEAVQKDKDKGGGEVEGHRMAEKAKAIQSARVALGGFGLCNNNSKKNVKEARSNGVAGDE